MFSLFNRVTTTTPSFDPLERITILAAECNPNYGDDDHRYSDGDTYPATHRSLADAIHFGESANHKALGFTIGNTYIPFAEEMYLHKAAWEVMALATEFGRTAGGTLDGAMKKLEAFLWASHERGDVCAVGLKPPVEIIQSLWK